jgi:serine/threonine-protein phosphatase PGAM5
MKIILVRHGECEDNVKLSEDRDSKLTQRGRKQVEHLANRLKDYKISEIYTSNLIRAKETSEIISKKIKVPIKGNFQELNEYSGKHLKKKIITLFNFRLKKLKRLLGKLAQEKEKDKTILIVAHGIANRIIIGSLLKFPISKQILRFTQDNACVNFLSWNEKYKNWCAWSVNDVSHIPIHLRNSEELNFYKNRK